MSSPLPPIHLTKTGRISKAKKGLKVHNCHKCGRSYTRAEHLRRHEKNHAQADAMVCNFANCGKSFVRKDLLQRHMERHNELDKTSSTEVASTYTPEGSPAVSSKVISTSMHMEPTTVTNMTSKNPHLSSPQPASPAPDAASIPRYTKNLFRTPQLPRTPQIPSGFSHVTHTSPKSTSLVNLTKQRASFIGHSSNQVPAPIDSITIGSGSWAESFNYSPIYSSSSGYASPIPGSCEYPNLIAHASYGHSINRTRASSNASFIEPWSFPPRSPTSTASTLGYWSSNEKMSIPSEIPCVDGSLSSTNMAVSACMDHMMNYGSFGLKSMVQRDEEERAILFGDQVYGMGPNAHTYPFEQYLDFFWRLFHPTFPIIHRPTFERMSIPPLLRAAMIAIGGQYSKDQAVKRRSRLLHDKCMKLFERREQEATSGTDRLCDYQAMFLVELLSQYRARRAAKVLSSRFKKTYYKAAEDFRYTTMLLHDVDLLMAYDGDKTSDPWHRWVELASWQRLHVACYILESQQTLLLAREPLPSLMIYPNHDLPFPCHISIWDAADATRWAHAYQQQPAELQYVSNLSSAVAKGSLDGFQSSLLINAYLNCPKSVLPYEPALPNFEFEHCLDASPTTRRQLLAAKLVQMTPIRALLAVSGESWIFSERVPSTEAFSRLKSVLRTWLCQIWRKTPYHEPVSPVKVALNLSVNILENTIQEQKDDAPLDLGSDLGIYYAGLVLWAITTAAHTLIKASLQKTQRVPPVPNPPEELLERSENANYMTLVTAENNIQTLEPLPASQPSALDSYDNERMLSHTQIMINAISFLSTVRYEYGEVSELEELSSRLPRLKRDCRCLLLWLKLRLRGLTLSAEESETNGLTNKNCDQLGELLDGITCTLERILSHGWDKWGI